ncbi:hypothetical protein EU805_07660 [Salipiger sp. IMCC34102]|uniref:hypothetical protein n=1 Tax=Salipiger sp. IMCC34102 TaxID=2510647 RepID=UPI00101DB6DF|nr:hypothetical protein [Salipiger sp. IMCC34102]RYH03576.1 hypothetical protein EU805_07660 [Salipiger sp. IMCC34102]
MRPIHALYTVIALATMLFPTMSQAQACGQTDEVFVVQNRGIFPPRIYHNDATGVCFVNESNRELWLLYTTDQGALTWSSRMPVGAETDQLARLGNNKEIFAVILYCGYDRYGNLKRCRDGENPTHYSRLGDMFPAVLYERPAILEY